LAPFRFKGISETGRTTGADQTRDESIFKRSSSCLYRLMDNTLSVPYIG